MDGEQGQFLSFDIGEERYAIQVVDVEVVLEMPVITRVPRAPAHLRGVVNHRGSVIPVVDLRVLFGLPATDLAGEMSVIVTEIMFDGERLTAGVLADAVQEVVSFEPAAIEDAPSWGSRVDDRFIAGIAKHGGRFIILLRLEQALSSANMRVEER